MKEFLNIVDENNNFTGEIAENSYVHDNGIWHREVACWLMNQYGNILVQKRALTKRCAPGKWDITAGHVKTNELEEDAMVREIKEELGIKIDKNQLKFLMIVKRKGITTKNNTFQYHYFAYTDKKIEEYNIQKEEVDKIKYISLEDLKNILLQKNEDYTFAKRKYMKDIYKLLLEKRN